MKNTLLLLLALAVFACDPGRGSADIGDAQASGDTPFQMDDAGEAPDDIDDLTRADNYPNPAEILNDVRITPIFHAGAVLQYAGQTIFVDPYDGAERYAAFGAPDLVLITHSHPDHMDLKTLGGMTLGLAKLVAPAAVADKVSNDMFREELVMANGDTIDHLGMKIYAVPAYNPPGNGKIFHPKGQFNGYVLEIDNERIYFAGDTGNIPDIAELPKINYAFVPINQPYTMTVDQAVDFVDSFDPIAVYPYHYRNGDGTFTDREEFKVKMTDRNRGVQVRNVEWYGEEAKEKDEAMR